MSDEPRERITVDDVAALLRGDTPSAPPTVTDRAVQRVRVESTALALLRTLGGAWLRVARATPDLLAGTGSAGPSADDDLEDTGEMPQA